jgi:uncharacterized protein (TIGR02996 family)
MQTEAEAFLQRIRAFPEDDTPRLIFADWLDAQGNPAGAEWGEDRARFIRVQIALARLAADEGREGETAVDRESRRALHEAERGLLKAHEEEWTAALRALTATGIQFHRGFAEEMNVDARDFVRLAHKIFDAAPVRHIHLLNVGGSLAAALACPYLSRLSALTVYAQHAGEPLARAVARSPHLAGLKALHLARNRFEDDAAEHLATSPIVAGLDELDLAENELGETAARALAASAHLGALRRLELRDNRLGPGGAEALAGSERLTSLVRLGLAGNEVGVARLHSLTRAHDLLRVPVLDLSANNLTPAGLQVILARPPGAADLPPVRLRELSLGQNPELGNDGARVLAGCPHLAGLRALRLTGCNIGDDGARALAESPYLRHLVTLDLANNPTGDPGFRPYLTASAFPDLRDLHYPAGLSKQMQMALRHRFKLDRG